MRARSCVGLDSLMLSVADVPSEVEGHAEERSIGHIVFAPVTFVRWRGRIVWILDEGDCVP